LIVSRFLSFIEKPDGKKGDAGKMRRLLILGFRFWILDWLIG